MPRTEIFRMTRFYIMSQDPNQAKEWWEENKREIINTHHTFDHTKTFIGNHNLLLRVESDHHHEPDSLKVMYYILANNKEKAIFESALKTAWKRLSKTHIGRVKCLG